MIQIYGFDNQFSFLMDTIEITCNILHLPRLSENKLLWIPTNRELHSQILHQTIQGQMVMMLIS